MLSLSLEWRAQGGKVPEGHSPPRGLLGGAPAGAPGIKEARSSAGHRVAPGSRGRAGSLSGLPAAESAASCRGVRREPRSAPPASPSDRPPARPPAQDALACQGSAHTSHKRRRGGTAGSRRPLPPGTLRTSHRSSTAPSPRRRRRPRRRRIVGASPGSASVLPAAGGSRPRFTSARS
uniref:Uncharacterized protein n=1 Tax=Mus musculus TaxID=10090 RepID=Q3U5A8_MOUSE|nr:unnamed protein product [Mus musculus]